MIIEQAGALCLSVAPKGEQQVLLVGSHRNGRWGLPKGLIDPGEPSHEAAAREAYEEAGIRGEVSDAIAGSFVYRQFPIPTANPG
jgi:8-oxo-dGTP pyrophosphatase MutT (NUDIX family)